MHVLPFPSHCHLRTRLGFKPCWTLSCCSPIYTALASCPSFPIYTRHQTLFDDILHLGSQLTPTAGCQTLLRTLPFYSQLTYTSSIQLDTPVIAAYSCLRIRPCWTTHPRPPVYTAMLQDLVTPSDDPFPSSLKARSRSVVGQQPLGGIQQRYLSVGVLASSVLGGSRVCPAGPHI